MKRFLIMITALSLLSAVGGCKKNDAAKKNESVATKYAKTKMSIYKNNTMDKKSWFTNLEKGEPVELLSEETVKVNSKDLKISKIKLSDDTIAFASSEYLAVKPIVFIEKDVKVYNRNNINSGEFAIIPMGTVAFVSDEKADWLQIDAGKIGDKWIVGKWVKGGISDSAEVVADAVTLEKTRNILSETEKGNKEEALALLKNLAAKNNAVGNLAKEDLVKIEGGSPDKQATDTQNLPPTNPQ
jgi:lipoprotein LenA